MSFRIAILGLYHESNTFVQTPTVLADFEKGHYLKGQAIRNEYQNAFHEIGGILEKLDQEGMEVIPVMYAEATPGGTIAGSTYQVLLDDLMLELEKVLPVDGFLVVPHGAGVSENFPDMDGHWLSRLRERVGSQVPIVGTLDLHANVSQLMVDSTDALIAYKQNPHIDQRECGKNAANILVRILRENLKVRQVLTQVPVAVSIEQQLTAHEPCKSLYSCANRLLEQDGLLSVSIQLGFPYADVYEMGTSLIVISRNSEEEARAAATTLEDYIISNRSHFVGLKNDISSALASVATSQKPVLLLDMGDNIGGGGPGNSISLLQAFEETKSLKYFLCIYDPQAVEKATKRSVGDSFHLSINGTDNNEVKKIALKVTLVTISDGHFRENNPRHGGQVNFNMGKTAIVSTEQGSVIMLTSLRTVPFSLNQLLFCNVDPSVFDAIVAKGVIAPVAAYSPVCPVIIQVNTPGVTQADMTMFQYKNRRSPLYPFEDITARFSPTGIPLTETN